jgi:ribosomal protein S18 acetylase RimI-like enzyme
MLEVTAQNDAAIRLYRRVGFLRRKTIYKPVLNWATMPNTV